MTVFRARPLALGIFIFLLVLLFLVLTEESFIVLLLSAMLFALCAVSVIFLLKTNKAAGQAFRGSVLLLFASLFIFLQCLFFTKNTLLPAQQMRGSSVTCTGRVSYVLENELLILECDNGVKLLARFTPQTAAENPIRENDLVSAKLHCHREVSDPDNTLRFQGVLVTADLERIKSEGAAEPGLFSKISQFLRSGFSPLKYRHLADALLLGNAQLSSPSLAEALSNTQTQHLLSVSGLHVSLLLFSAEKYLSRLRLSLRLQSLLLCFITLLYMALLDFSPSVTRAGIMTAMTFTAKALRQNNDSFTSLMLSAGILCCADPFTLFDASFQLSFLSTLGILRIFVPQSQRMELSPFFKGKSFLGALGKQGLKSVFQTLLMTFSALVFSLPVLLGFSSQLNLWAFIPNLILIPLFTPALTALFFYLPLSLLLSAAGLELLLWPASKMSDFFLLLFDKTAAVLGNADVFCIMNSRASQGIILTLCVLLTLFLSLTPSRRRRLLFASFCLALPVLLAVNQLIFWMQKAKICVLSTDVQHAILVQTRESSVLWLPEGCPHPELLIPALEDENLKTLDALVVCKQNAKESLFTLSPFFEVNTLYAADPSDEDLRALCEQTGTRLLPLPSHEISSGSLPRARYEITSDTLSLDLLLGDVGFSYRWGYDSSSRPFVWAFENDANFAVFCDSPALIPSDSLQSADFFAATESPFFDSDFAFPLSDANRLTLYLFPGFHLTFYDELSKVNLGNTDKKFSTSAS